MSEKTVKMKSYQGMKDLVRSGEIRLVSSSDDGERSVYAIECKGFTIIYGVDSMDMGEEFTVIEDGRYIQKSVLDRVGVLFD